MMKTSQITPELEPAVQESAGAFAAQSPFTVHDRPGLQKTLAEMEKRARHHHWVAGVTLAATAVLLVIALFPVIGWLKDPFVLPTQKVDIEAAGLSTGLRVFGIVMIGYLTRLLASVYRYNIQLWGHYSSRLWALRIAENSDCPLDVAVHALSPSWVMFSYESIALADGAGSAKKEKE